MATRRQFVLSAVPVSALLIASTRMTATEVTRLDEADPLAVALGYRHDAGSVDAARFPTYAAGHNCAGCQLFQADAAAPWGPCGVVPGKLVNAKGWCAAWVRKA